MTKADIINLMLDIRHFVTDKSELHDPLKMREEIVEFIDIKTKEIAK